MIKSISTRHVYQRNIFSFVVILVVFIIATPRELSFSECDSVNPSCKFANFKLLKILLFLEFLLKIKFTDNIDIFGSKNTEYDKTLHGM